MRKDLMIIGTGPAGLSAAITAKIRNLDFDLIGNETVSKKVEKAHEIQNYPGLPHIAGHDLAQAMVNHVKDMGVEFKSGHVGMIYSMGDYFSIQIDDQIEEATSIILATGVVQGKPYPGEDEYLGRGVSYCATCDAPLYKGKTAIIIGASPKEEDEANFMAEVAGKVIYVPLYKDEVKVSEKVEVVNAKPVEIVAEEKKVLGLKVEKDGAEELISGDGVFILRDAVAPEKLVPGLATDGAHVACDLNMKTNIPGLFVAGDIAGTPYQYVKSAGQGNVAALSATAYVTEIKKKNA